MGIVQLREGSFTALSVSAVLATHLTNTTFRAKWRNENWPQPSLG